MPAKLISLAHLSVSSVMNFPKADGEPANPVAPNLANRALILESERPGRLAERNAIAARSDAPASSIAVARIGRQCRLSGLGSCTEGSSNLKTEQVLRYLTAVLQTPPLSSHAFGCSIPPSVAMQTNRNNVGPRPNSALVIPSRRLSTVAGRAGAPIEELRRPINCNRRKQMKYRALRHVSGLRKRCAMEAAIDWKRGDAGTVYQHSEFVKPGYIPPTRASGFASGWSGTERPHFISGPVARCPFIIRGKAPRTLIENALAATLRSSGGTQSIGGREGLAVVFGRESSSGGQALKPDHRSKVRGGSHGYQSRL